MAADRVLTPGELLDEAREIHSWTFIYRRINHAGRPVRDAKFVDAAPTYGVALDLFRVHVHKADVGLMAVLKGRVRTIDRFAFADEPAMGTAEWEQLVAQVNAETGPLHPYTVFAEWDNGDGPMRHVVWLDATSPLAAELAARQHVTTGRLWVGAVVAGRVPVEDDDAIYTTLDGQPPRRPPWWRRLLRR